MRVLGLAAIGWACNVRSQARNKLTQWIIQSARVNLVGATCMVTAMNRDARVTRDSTANAYYVKTLDEKESVDDFVARYI